MSEESLSYTSYPVYKKAGSSKKPLSIYVEVVDNGFLVTIGKTKFVFDHLNKFEEWLTENFDTPEKGNKFLDKINKLDKPIDDWNWEKIIMPKQPYQPYIGPQPISPGTITWTSPTTTTTGTVNTI